MSNEEQKRRVIDVHPMGPDDPSPWEPFPEDAWAMEVTPKFTNAQISGVNYKGTYDGGTIGGSVSTGTASLQVREGQSNVAVSYAQDKVTASVGYTVGTSNASVTTTYNTATGLAVGGVLKFGSTTVNFNDSSIGATYNFGGGISAGISGSPNGGFGVTFAGSNWGGGSGFSFDLSARNTGGSWSVDAQFNLVFSN